MRDYYYSKKLEKYFPTRLDFLLYAHDGRGLGHVSRTVAVGLALKRLYPKSRVLLVTGSAQAGMMIGQGPLDWIKLPSYQTVLTGGVAEGRDGNAGYYKSVLGNLRGEMLASLVKICRPHCALVDHNPFGKRQELLEALELAGEMRCQWFLGLRGIIGDDKDLWAAKSSELVRKHYRGVFWYGDSTVLGGEPLHRIGDHFQCPVTEMGYVSRALEFGHLHQETAAADGEIACTVSLPWFGERSTAMVDSLHRTLQAIGAGRGSFHLFVPEAQLTGIREVFSDLSFCRVEPISERYLDSLARSGSAMIYGGYNSLVDVAATGLPALVVLRSTQDREQQEHVSRLQRCAGLQWRVVEEDEVAAPQLEDSLRFLLSAHPVSSTAIDFKGAENTARLLHRMLREGG